ncbi:hypothetical protein BT69DRAFT_1277720 [Atractiella rhizophila]|nr:hypothetical protein BT69DRAFT_1277720 [Atractiella rhizophila]
MQPTGDPPPQLNPDDYNFMPDIHTLQYTPPEGFQGTPIAQDAYFTGNFVVPPLSPMSLPGHSLAQQQSDNAIEKAKPPKFGDTKEERLEKNRISAAKSRQKKKAWIENLSDSLSSFSSLSGKTLPTRCRFLIA